MAYIIGLLVLPVLAPLTILVLYQWVLAIVALLNRPSISREALSTRSARVLVLMPAHNEELCLSGTLASLKAVRYPLDLVKIVVVADRCTDGTVKIARAEGVECLERSDGQPGKGPAIAWALEQVKNRGTPYDVLLVLDADTLVAPDSLDAFVDAISSGREVQQGFCYISNPWQSLFTRVIAVTSMMRNGLFYAGKTRLGWPAMLAGTGMCFSHRIIDRYGWTALSVGEDWEFSAALVLAGERIYFNPSARVFQLESVGMRQASGQRLRWAGGKHGVVGTSVWELLCQGFHQRSWYLVDAALTILAPNYSTQASLATACLLASLVTVADPSWGFLFPWSVAVLALLAAYFGTGALLTDSPVKALVGILIIPVFLPWRLAIEVLGFLGYGRKQWIRTSRLSASQ